MAVKTGAEGYLTDILDVTQNILSLKKYYQSLKALSDESDDALSAKRELINRRHLLKLYAVYAAFGFVIACILFLCGINPLFTAIPLIILLPLAGVYITVIAYKKKVLNPCEEAYSKKREELEKKIGEAKGELYTQKILYESLMDKLSPECRHSLAVYVMRNAARDGLVLNVFKAQDFYRDRERVIESAEDKKQIADRILDSQKETEVLTEFLEMLNKM